MAKYRFSKEERMIQMSAAKHAEEIRNSNIKRGEIDTKNIEYTHHVLCGCGDPKCVFITTKRKEN